MNVGLGKAGTNCSRCGGSGWLRKDVPVGHPDFGHVFPCPNCNPYGRSTKFQPTRGLTVHQRQLRMDDIETAHRADTQLMRDQCSRFIDEPVGILLLHGGPGNGKSMAAAACVNALENRGIDVVYTTGHEYMLKLRAGSDRRSGGDGEGAHKTLDAIQHARVLVVDALDQQYITTWTKADLEYLIHLRHQLGEEQGYGTILVMNDDPHEFSSETVSRLYAGINVVVRNDDSDLRPALKR